jgi:hypothetical protein
MEEFKYPQKLVDFLTEQDLEGYEIFTTSSIDSSVWIIKSNIGSSPWITLVQYEAGGDDFTLMNITDLAFNRLEKVMKECREETEAFKSKI